MQVHNAVPGAVPRNKLGICVSRRLNNKQSVLICLPGAVTLITDHPLGFVGFDIKQRQKERPRDGRGLGGFLVCGHSGETSSWNLITGRDSQMTVHPWRQPAISFWGKADVAGFMSRRPSAHKRFHPGLPVKSASCQERPLLLTQRAAGKVLFRSSVPKSR
jgi:hypothetical protein